MPPKNFNESKSSKSNLLPRLLILAGIVVVVVSIILIKNQSDQDVVAVDETPEQQFDRYLAEQKPFFAFFHSNNCESCLIMMETVEQVYPAFQEDIALIDVNVYDPINQSLLQRAAIQSIPTQVFVDSTGNGIVSLGILTDDQLIEQLSKLVVGE